MDAIIETVLKNTLIARKDLFGEDCCYVGFDERDADSRQFGVLQSSFRFGRIAYRRRYDFGARYSRDLILKVTPPVSVIKDFSIMKFSNEVLFYTKLLPLFQTLNEDNEGISQQLFPQYYHSLLRCHVRGEKTGIIVFENLRSSGFSQCNRKSFLDYDHLSLMMRKLGQFHAHSYRARQEKPNEFYALVHRRLETNGLYFTHFPGLIPSKKRGFEPLTTYPDHVSQIQHSRLLLANSNEMFERSLRGNEKNCTHVLCHGDFFGGNVLFAYKGGKPVDMKMVDLGTWRFASPVFDLAMVLYYNADQEMRSKNWDNLLDEYYTAVRSTFPSARVPSKDAILAEFKTEATFTAYLFASWFLPALIAHDIGCVPDYKDLVPLQYRHVPFQFLPPHLMELALQNIGGDRATCALTEILKDMIDRKFV